MQYAIADAEQLEALLSEALASGPLYRVVVYNGRGGHGTYSSGNSYASLPEQLNLYCGSEKCEMETWWKTENPHYAFGQQFIQERLYTCRNCGTNQIRYFFIWQERKDSTNVFVKVGQYPELEERVSESLTKGLGISDLKMYKKALRMRNFGLGLAAVAYMRRVVEDRMSDMLEILHEPAIAHNAPADLLARHEEMKNEKRFSEKVNYAGDLLPAYLRPSGKPNPMAILHELASDGIHGKSDEECVEIFDKCRATFEYVFGKMRIEAEAAKDFVKGMAELSMEKAKAVAAKPIAKKV